jgi:hypothetical protein
MKITKLDLVLLIIIMLALWNLDICITTMNLGMVGNGFYYVSPDKMYHIDICIILISVMLILFKKDYEVSKG